MSGPFKMKGFSGFSGSPLARNTKPEGYYTVKDASNPLTETGQGKDVTVEYTKKGSKSTRDHIASGGRVLRMPDGSLALTTTTKK